jgi:photosystem II stability/assembly factor-like uncharacterized protein
VIAGGCALRRSDDAGATFSRLPWTASDLNCPYPIASIAFPTDQNGYIAVANGTVFATADGGRSWTRKTALPRAQTSAGPALPKDLYFTSAETGVGIVGSQVFRTTDGGGSWTLVLNHAASLNGLFFVNATTGYAVGSAGSLFRTDDGGASWTQRPAVNGSLTAIHCADASTCLATIDGGDHLLRTINGGVSFSAVTPSTEKVFAVAFVSPLRAIAAGALGATVVSNDAGATWSTVGARLSDEFTRLRAMSRSLVFAVGKNGALARTTDGGATWTSLSVSTSSNVLDVSFPSESVGYALDDAGSVLRTDNGGASWKILDTGTTSRPNALLALDANKVLLIGPRGIRRSTNGGGGFTRVRGKALTRARLVDFDRVRGTVFAFGFDSLFTSRDSGKSWRKLRRPPTQAGLAAVDFVRGSRGFGLTLDGRVWETRNRGRRWRELPGIGNESAFELVFVNTRTGYAAVRQFAGEYAEGYVLRTADGGRTWQPQLVADEGVGQNGLAATGRDTAQMLSLNGSLFVTSSGGRLGKPSSLTLTTAKRKLRKAATIKVSGRFSPAEGGEQVTVSMRGARLVRWRRQTVTAASNGSFTTSWKVNGSSYFVAQWAGDDDRAGDGSRLLKVSLR